MFALSGIRVLEISSTVAAAYCARQFALWGAEVFAIRDRSQKTLLQSPTYSQDGQSHSLLQECLNTGKHNIEISGVSADLIENADIVITDQPITELQQLPGLNDVAKWPIVVDISPFGRSGPYAQYAASELTVEAMSGFLSINGCRDRAPLRMPGNLIAYICGVNGFIAGLAALHRLHHCGVKEQIEVSWLEAIVSIVPTLRTQIEGKPEGRDGGPGSKPLGVRLYKFDDGYLSFNPALKTLLEVFLDVIGLDENAIPTHLDSTKKRQNFAALSEFVQSLDSPFGVDDLFAILSSPPHSSAVGKVKTPAELLTDPQLKALDFLRHIEHPGLGSVTRAGPPARMLATPAMPPTAVEFTDQSTGLWTRRDPSALGREPSASGQEPSALNKDHSAAIKKQPGLNQPLANIRIIDLTQAWIGPYASQILSDLGAEVIKVESLSKPDVWRSLPPVIPGGIANENARLVNTSSNFNSVNRDKKSLALDLTNPRGRELFLDLVADADIVMENYTPNVMKRFQLSYDDLKKVNQKLIMTSFSGYGQTGPYSGYRANGTTIEATAGWDSLFGYRDGPPLVMGFYQTDAITGLQMAATTLAALNHRNRTGQGQYIKGSMFEAAVSYIDELILEASLGQVYKRYGNRHPDMAPQGVYRCQGEDQWVAISVCDDEQFKRLQAQPGSGLTDPDLLELGHRLDRHDFVDEQLERWTQQFSPQEITDLLQAIGIPSAPVQRTDQILTDPHLRHQKWFHPLKHPDLGTHLYDGVPWHFSDSKLNSNSPAPRLGQHSRELLHEQLGLSQAEIDALFEQGISGQVS